MNGRASSIPRFNLEIPMPAGVKIPPRKITYTCAWDIGDRAVIDGDGSLVAIVTGVCFRAGHCNLELAWVHNGDTRAAWIEEWRCKPADAPR